MQHWFVNSLPAGLGGSTFMTILTYPSRHFFGSYWIFVLSVISSPFFGKPASHFLSAFSGFNFLKHLLWSLSSCFWRIKTFYKSSSLKSVNSPSAGFPMNSLLSASLMVLSFYAVAPCWPARIQSQSLNFMIIFSHFCCSALNSCFISASISGKFLICSSIALALYP